MKGWSEKTLDELGSISRGRSRHRPRDAEHLYGGPYPFIQTADVKHANLYVDSYSQTYSDAGLAQSKLWEPGTLCITIAANIAETAILKMQSCFPDSIIGFIPHRGVSDARFIKYLFDAMLRKKFQAYSKGSTQDNLSQEKILSLKFLVPHFKVQQRIADTLSAYDDLIENNRRRIQLLEESARMLYREWFVRLRFPGHEHVRIVDGVPEGWERKTLGEVAPFNYGKSLTAENRIGGNIPVYASSGIVGTHNQPLVKGNGIIIGRKGNVGSIYWVAKDYFPIDTVYYIKSDDANLYLYYVLKNMSFLNSDVAVPGLNRDYAHRKTILIPDKKIYTQFIESAYTLHNQIETLHSYNDKLAQARDLLLPKLMNGEVAV